MQNLISPSQSQALTGTQIQAVKNYYTGLSQIFEFHQGLTLAERRRMMRPSRQNLLLVQDSIDAITHIPEVCPAFLDKAYVEEVSELFHQLRFLEQIHKQVGDALLDLRLIAGNKAFRHARLIYNAAKSAALAGYPKARPIYDQMRQRFDINNPSLPIAQQDEGEAEMTAIVEDIVELKTTGSEEGTANKAA